jgi:GT2 family glycosyltransferase
MTAPALSLIVCTYRRPDAVRRLLSAVASQITPPDEVLIVDGSDDRHTDAVVTEHAGTWRQGRLSYTQVPPEHRGLTRQRNYGIARVTGEIVAFLDDDTAPRHNYFEEILACFSRHPDAAGVGGYIAGEIGWVQDEASSDTFDTFRWQGWTRREDYRWRLRRMLGLGGSLPPGWMPPSGHGRPVSFLPPDGNDYPVEFIMGGASAWRRSALDDHQFGEYFDGYGLYEDLDFCIRVSRASPLFLCSQAQLEHHHDPAARPHAFRYGTMVVRNGWYVWRQRWPSPSAVDRVKWWLTTTLLAACRAGDVVRGPRRLDAVREALGRFWGMVSLPTAPARERA